jgi:hypothetical protein
MRTGIPNVRGIGTSQQALDALPVADVPKELQGPGVAEPYSSWTKLAK